MSRASAVAKLLFGLPFCLLRLALSLKRSIFAPPSELMLSTSPLGAAKVVGRFGIEAFSKWLAVSSGSSNLADVDLAVAPFCADFSFEVPIAFRVASFPLIFTESTRTNPNRKNPRRINGTLHPRHFLFTLISCPCRCMFRDAIL